MCVKLFDSLCNLCKNQGKLSVISFNSEILTQIIFVILLGKCNMVIPDVTTFETKDMLEPIKSCHLADLVLSLHSLVYFWLLKHLLDEVVLEDNSIFNFSVDGSLFLELDWGLNCTLMRKILKEW